MRKYWIKLRGEANILIDSKILHVTRIKLFETVNH